MCTIACAEAEAQLLPAAPPARDAAADGSRPCKDERRTQTLSLCKLIVSSRIELTTFAGWGEAVDEACP